MRIGKKLRVFFIVNLLLVLFLLISSYTVSTIVTKEIYEKTYLDYSEQISKLSRVTFNGLEALVYDFSQDEAVFNLIMQDDTKKNKENKVIENLKYAKGLLITTSFAESLDVVDAKENELYSSKGYHKDFDMRTRPWYDDAIKQDLNGKKVIITDIHRDFLDNRYTMSILSFIKDKNKNVIGCVILNAYMDEFTRYMEDVYGKNGNVKIYVKLKNGGYYGYKGGVREVADIHNDKDSYIVYKDNLLFEFNTHKAIVNTTINKVNQVNIFIFIVFLIITLIMSLVVKKTILNSLLQNVSKLKRTLQDLDKFDEDEIENKNGFDQLDYIVNSFDDAINEKAREYILTDSLTKVLNRRGLEQEFTKLSKESARMAIIFIDLDKFKNINDVYGHAVGDQFLKEFSDVLKNALGNRGVVARISGDEFIILYKYFWNNDELEIYYKEHIEKLFGERKLVEDRIIVRYSVGVSIYPKDGRDLGELIKKSDYAMYNRKKKGVSNKLAFFDDKGYEEIKQEEAMSIELQKAIKNEELFLLYQPIVSQGQKVVKAEALMRWNSKNLGFIPPDKFIRIAEDNKEIINIGYWAFKRVCEDINKLKENGIEDIVINVNVSAIQLLEPSFAVNVKHIVNEYNVKCSSICIEITESVMIEEDEVSFTNLNSLKNYGFKLSLDDFGTGYTSFAYLKKFQGESLKIDKTILDDANENEYRIINSIKEIGKELDFRIVIEGVEEEEQFNKLKEINCDLFQGYYFSRPISLEELIKYIKKVN